MNVLEIVSGHGINGAVTHCLMLTRALVAQGHSITVVCRHNSWIGQQAAKDGITVIESDLHRLPFDEFRRISEYAHANKIDVIHTHMTRAHNFGVFLRLFSGIPCVTTAHSHNTHFYWLMADHIIAVSDLTRRFHRKRHRIPEHRIDTIHGFVDIERFMNVMPDSRDKIREELGIKADEIMLGAIGDFLPRKGQHFLIRAMPQILARFPNVRLALIGSVRVESYARQVKAEIEQLGLSRNVLWLGHRQDIPEFLSAIDIYVLPSLEEMFGIALAEAMAAGRPVVTTACGGPQEILSNGEGGLLVAPGDPKALADGVLMLLCDEDLRNRIGKLGQEVIWNGFRVETQAEKILALFSRVSEIKKSRLRRH